MKCAHCSSDAIGACAHCGRFYCKNHGKKAEGFSAMKGKWLCEECAPVFERNQAIMLPAVVASLAIGVITLAFLAWK
ncbi:MAG: hypothetical protein JWN86_4656 [Planctomycetota bacterium]|nr:hypothetical protein [Planctomycetota bacterium]